MFMTNEEIIFRYNYRMEQDDNRIKILSEFNCCTKEKIAEILGVAVPKNKHYPRLSEEGIIDDEKALIMYKTGSRDEDIAKAHQVSKSTARMWRLRRGLPPVTHARSRKKV